MLHVWHPHSFVLSVAQNQWIRESLFDGHGNYVYCYECILAYINVGTQQLAHQCKIKRELSQHTKSKSGVSQLKLEKFVSTDANFQDWWKELGDDEDVEVRYSHEQHGLRSKTSNQVKTDVMNEVTIPPPMTLRQIADAQHSTSCPNSGE